METNGATGDIPFNLFHLGGTMSGDYAMAPTSPQPRSCALAAPRPCQDVKPSQHLGLIDLKPAVKHVAPALPADARGARHVSLPTADLDCFLPETATTSLSQRQGARPRGDDDAGSYLIAQLPCPIRCRPEQAAESACRLDTPPVPHAIRENRARRLSASTDAYGDGAGGNDDMRERSQDLNLQHPHHMHDFFGLISASRHSDLRCKDDVAISAGVQPATEDAIRAAFGGALGRTMETDTIPSGQGLRLPIRDHGHTGMARGMGLLAQPRILQLLTLADVDAIMDANLNDALGVGVVCRGAPVSVGADSSAVVADYMLSSGNLASTPSCGPRPQVVGRALSFDDILIRANAVVAARAAHDDSSGSSDHDLLPGRVTLHRRRRGCSHGGALEGQGGETRATGRRQGARTNRRNGLRDNRLRHRACHQGYECSAAAGTAADANVRMLAAMAALGASAWVWRWRSGTANSTAATGVTASHASAAAAAGGTLHAAAAAAPGQAAVTAYEGSDGNSEADYGGDARTRMHVDTRQASVNREALQRPARFTGGMPAQAMPYDVCTCSYDDVCGGGHLPAGAGDDVTCPMGTTMIAMDADLMVPVEEVPTPAADSDADAAIAATAAGAAGTAGKASKAAAPADDTAPASYPWGDTSVRRPQAAVAAAVCMISFALGTPPPLARSLSSIASFPMTSQAASKGLVLAASSATAAAADAAAAGAGDGPRTTTVAMVTGAAATAPGSTPAKPGAMRSVGGRLACPIISIGELGVTAASGATTGRGPTAPAPAGACAVVAGRKGARCDVIGNEDHHFPLGTLAAALEGKGAVLYDSAYATIGPHGVPPLAAVMSERVSPGEAAVMAAAGRGEVNAVGPGLGSAAMTPAIGCVAVSAANVDGKGRRGLGARLLLGCFGRG